MKTATVLLLMVLIAVGTDISYALSSRKSKCVKGIQVEKTGDSLQLTRIWAYTIRGESHVTSAGAKLTPSVL